MAKIANSPPLQARMCALVRAAGLDPNNVSTVSLDYRAPGAAATGPHTVVRVELFMTDAMLDALTSNDGED